jgi:hypothetical protein
MKEKSKTPHSTFLQDGVLIFFRLMRVVYWCVLARREIGGRRGGQVELAEARRGRTTVVRKEID